MAGRLTDPKVITDYNQKMVCILPPGFYFNDDRWDQIWTRYGDKGETLTSVDLLAMFPQEEVLQKMVADAEKAAENISDSVHAAIEKRR